jgi:hypothetical protein
MTARADLRRRRSALTRAWDDQVGSSPVSGPGGRRAPRAARVLRTEIATSWSRSAGHVSPLVRQAPLADLAETGAIWEASPLRAVVRNIQDQLRSAADDADLVVAVTDPAARILWTYGGHAMRDRAEAVNFIPGGRWDEQSVGTNALDLALRLDGGATVYSAEHFSSCVHDWVCWAAPVYDPGTGRQLGVLDLSTTWDRSHPMGMATAQALASLVQREVAQGRTLAGQREDETARPVLDVRLLGRESMRLGGRPLRLTRRQTEIVALLALTPGGLDLGELHAQLYGDRPVSTGTLKAEMSQLRALLGGRLTSRPYQIDLPVRCDVMDLIDRLRAGDTAGAVDSFGGDLLSWSDSPALADHRHFVTVALRTALLTDPQRAAALRYAQVAPYDLEPVTAAAESRPAC